jgi:hypothetical protein
MALIREPLSTFRPGAGQTTTVSLSPLTLPTGRLVTDFTSFALVVREDPEWPRTGAAKAAAVSADPLGDGWEIAVTAEGELDDDVPVFTFVAPDGAGERRYAFDAWGFLSGGEEIQLVESTWLTVGARVVPVGG